MPAWIEAAQPTYPCLIDRTHHVAELYHMVNVPQATWIDEAGRIVRPPENAGQSDAFRKMDRASGTMTPEQIAERTRVKAVYVEAIDPNGVSRRRTIDTIVPLNRVFLPSVFRRWRGLQSFDVCQEPAQADDPSAAPPPLTQFAVTRKAAAKIDWATASLSDLVAAAAESGGDQEYGLGGPDSLYLFVAPDLTTVPAYRRARVAAGLPAATPTTSTTSTTSTTLSG